MHYRIIIWTLYNIVEKTILQAIINNHTQLYMNMLY